MPGELRVGLQLGSQALVAICDILFESQHLGSLRLNLSAKRCHPIGDVPNAVASGLELRGRRMLLAEQGVLGCAESADSRAQITNAGRFLLVSTLESVDPRRRAPSRASAWAGCCLSLQPTICFLF